MCSHASDIAVSTPGRQKLKESKTRDQFLDVILEGVYNSWRLRLITEALLAVSVALVRERTTPTERPPPVGEVSANFCG